MRLLALFFLLFTQSFTQAQQRQSMLEFSLAGGFQSVNLKWSIAGNLSGRDPDILSEVQWQSIQGISFFPELKIRFARRWLAGVAISRCYVSSGRALDRDYQYDGRQQQTYDAELKSDKGRLESYSTYLRYFLLAEKKFTLAMRAGFKIENENFYLLNDIDLPGSKVLNSTYQTNWKGGLMGFDLAYRCGKILSLQAGFNYSQLTYTAKADWNLIDAFRHPLSFDHSATGYEIEGNITSIISLNSKFDLNLQGGYLHAETGNGIDRLYLESGEIRRTQFNGASKRMTKISIGFSSRF